MTTEVLFNRLELASGPVSETILDTGTRRVIVFAFNPGMGLKRHVSKVPVRLMVIQGRLTYHEADRIRELHTMDVLDIPVDEFHSLEAVEQSVLLLIKG